MATLGLGGAIHYWFVDHPFITQYEWKPNQSPGASPLFLAVTVVTYLALTLTLHRFSLIHAISPAALRLISATHSLILCILSLLMAIGTTLSAIHQSPPGNPTWAICFPAGRTQPQGPTFFWAHVFYFSKILEFIDTLLILLSGSRRRRLSFLHVYHHATVLIMCYLWLSESQSLFPVALVTNAAVHVVMYGYYFLCAVGIRPPWKRLVTNFQIVQFVFSFAISGRMLYEHFTGSGCQGIRAWCFNAVFNASLLALFFDFHSRNYANKSGFDGRNYAAWAHKVHLALGRRRQVGYIDGTKKEPTLHLIPDSKVDVADATDDKAMADVIVAHDT